MTTLGPYTVHPFADKFPLITGEEFETLVRDIKVHGLREPIVLNHDQTVLLDGRNRYLACAEAAADTVFDTLPARYTEQMILDFIISANIERRHLNAGQRAVLALDYEAAYAEAAKVTQSGEGKAKPHGESISVVADLPQLPEARPKSRERAAQATGASGRGVQQAKALQRDAPDLAERVLSGEIALDAADRERRQRVAAQPKPEKPHQADRVMLTLLTHDGQEIAYPQPKSKATFNQTPGEGISWAEWSWNPVTGCLHGCTYCYAREIAVSQRFKASYPAEFTPLFHPERLSAPRNTVIPATHAGDPAWSRVFVCSMADLYGRWVPDEWIEQVHESMLASPAWEYLLLTKFPGRYVGLDMPAKAWLGTSVDEQKRVRLAEEAFRQVDGVVKWLSLEPLKAPLEFTDLSMFDWVVIGSQTETRQPGGTVPAFAPPFEWVARIVAQAREAGCKVNCKPNLLGSTNPQMPGMQMPEEYPVPRRAI